MNAAITHLLTRKDALGQSRLDVDQDDFRLADGEALFKIDRVALTANNITYASLGDAMQYWHFFPTQDAQWGHMPVWGFADVVASTVPGVEVGERFYGYFPIASHIRMRPERVSPRGFYDGADHRRSLVSAYNQYTRCSQDPAYSRANENYQMILRPLFITSFMLADFLQDNAFFGATRLVVSSASSKTAYGTAFCLRQEHGIELIGLTSARNRAFVEGLGCYRRTAAYEDVKSLPTDQPTLYVDFLGDEPFRATIHEHFGRSLVYDCLVGITQNKRTERQQNLPGPEPKFFFAPVQIRKRNVDWGYEAFNQRFKEAQESFIRQVSTPGNPWIRLTEHRGFDAAQTVIANLYDGKVDPRDGHIVRLG